MRVESTLRPEQVSIFVIGDRALLKFAENVQEVQKEDQLVYAYDEYQIETKNRTMLKISVDKNFEAWLEKAKQVEVDALAAEIRDKRNKMLAETDFYFLTDRELDVTTKTALGDYRQKLRDITKQEGFPKEVKWPERVS